MPALRCLGLIALLLALAARAGAQAPGLPAPRPPVIVLSTGHATEGYAIHEIHASDRIVIRHLSPGSGLERQLVQDRPGAYARVAAFLAFEGVRIVARDGPARAPCPGAVNRIEALPPVGQFRVFRTGCPGGEGVFAALSGGILTAIAAD